MDKLTKKKVLLVLGLLAAAVAITSFNPSKPPPPPALSIEEIFDPRPADLDLSAVRYIRCAGWIGSGFLVGDRILLTALHVGNGKNCVDVMSGKKLKLYNKDESHDLALMTGDLPTDIPYVKLSCEAYKKNVTYGAYGVTPYGETRPILRMNHVIATKEYTPFGFTIEDNPAFGMRIFLGFVAPGMSGGPVIDSLGYAHSLVNASSSNHFLSYEFKDTILCPK